MLKFAVELRLQFLKLWNRELCYVDCGSLEWCCSRCVVHTLAGARLSLF